MVPDSLPDQQGGQPEGERDHLFVSYAGEDVALAEWLTLKLSSEGYRVWCDRFKLLGGESYPKDITKAIRDRTFRFLALLSRSSVLKDNPLKERTLAQAIARERAEEFILPLNVDGIKSSEVDFQSADIVWIPFYESWSRGLAQLLKKLGQISTPRDKPTGLQAVSQWLLSDRYVVNKPETLSSNLVRVIEIPSRISRFEFEGTESFKALAKVWPYFRQNAKTAWSFFPPPSETTVGFKERASLEVGRDREGLPFKSVEAASQLIRNSITVYCRSRGLFFDEGSGEVYFPHGLLPNGWLSFVQYSGEQTRVKLVGERTFRVRLGIRQRSRYHLSAGFDPYLARFGGPTVSISLGVRWTDLEEMPVSPATAQRRRKALTKSWWNHEWLSRLTALLYWLSEGRDSILIGHADSGSLAISARPILASIDQGIDESLLTPMSREEDESELEDEGEEEEEGALETGEEDEQ